jgi:hypothetical protein
MHAKASAKVSAAINTEKLPEQTYTSLISFQGLVLLTQVIVLIVVITTGGVVHSYIHLRPL